MDFGHEERVSNGSDTYVALLVNQALVDRPRPTSTFNICKVLLQYLRREYRQPRFILFYRPRSHGFSNHTFVKPKESSTDFLGIVRYYCFWYPQSERFRDC